MDLRKTELKELSRKEYEKIVLGRYAPRSRAIAAVATAVRAARREGAAGDWDRVEVDLGKPLMRRPDGSIAVPANVISGTGSKRPFAAIAERKGGRWVVSHALVADGQDGPQRITEGHDLGVSEAFERPETAEQAEARKAAESIGRAKSAASEASRLGAPPQDSVLNAIHSASIKAGALQGDATANRTEDASRAKAPAAPDGPPKKGLAAAIKRADPNAVVESRGGKMLRITVATAAIAEAVDPNAIATSDSSKLLKAASGAARLPNGNLVMGGATALEGLALSLDRRLPAHDVHLSIEAMEEQIRKVGGRSSPSGRELAGALGGAMRESERAQVSAKMAAMVPQRAGLGV